MWAVVDAVCSPGIHMEVTETCQIYQQLLISGSSLIMTSAEVDDNNRIKCEVQSFGNDLSGGRSAQYDVEMND